ncbi:MAG: hypothetical protein ABW352_24090 [Polyangiales bacterium]
MSEPEAPKTPEPSEKPQDTVGWPDAAAIGIGCLVVVIFFAAIVLVAIMRGE